MRIPGSAKAQVPRLVEAPATKPAQKPPAVEKTQTGGTYEGGGQATALPDAKPLEPAKSTIAIRAAQLIGPPSVASDVEALIAKAKLAASALPDVAEQALQSGLATSARRVLTAFEEGRISEDEAREATRMLSEMMDSLIALETGKIAARTSLEPMGGSDLRAFELTTTSGDVLRVGVRPTTSEQGQARLKLESVADDGQSIPKARRMMVRFDLEGVKEGKPADAVLDVQFGFERPPPGVERFNKRIHGVLLDDEGNPVKNRLGNTVPDHHFKDVVPDALDDPEAFASFTQSFLDAVAKDAS